MKNLVKMILPCKLPLTVGQKINDIADHGLKRVFHFFLEKKWIVRVGISNVIGTRPKIVPIHVRYF